MAPEPKRRDTPGEGLPGIVGVDDPGGDHFLVHYANGTSVPVPKEGLKPDTLAHIEGMAHGGLVIGGGRVDPGGANDDEFPPVPDRGLTEAEKAERGKGPHFPRMSRPAVTPSEQDSGEPPERVYMADGGGVPDGGNSMFQPLAFMGGVDAGMPAPGGLPFQFTPGGAIPDPLLPNVSPAAMGATEAVTQGAPYATPATPATPQIRDMRGAAVLAPTPPAPKLAEEPVIDYAKLLGMGGSGALGELNKGIEEQRTGLAAQVEAEKARDAALVQLQDQHIAQMQAMEAQHAEEAAAHQRRADDLFMAVQNGKVDPNRVWATADIGQKVAAGIGILLSGIGSGMGGGPNLALQVIDRTIDRDIDAQKTNLENQKGLLGYYLQQGRDMLSAHALAKADLKDMLAAQVARVSSSFGGQEAAARAQLVGGQLRTEAAGKRQEIMARDFQMKAQKMAMIGEMEKNRLISQYAAAGRGGQSALMELLPEKVRARMVRLPNGKMAPAADDSAAKKYREASQATDKMRRTLQRYRSVLEKGHPWIPSGVGGDRQTAKALRAELILNLKDMNTLGALQPGELALIEPMVPDITDTFTRDDTLKQGMDALGYTIDDRVNSNLNAFLE